MNDDYHQQEIQPSSWSIPQVVMAEERIKRISNTREPAQHQQTTEGGSTSVASSENSHLPCIAEDEEGEEEDSRSRSDNEEGSMDSEELQRDFQQQTTRVVQQQQHPGKKGSNNDLFDCRICTVALCVCFIIVGAIVGVVVGLFLTTMQQQYVVSSPTATADESPSSGAVTSTATETLVSTSSPVPPHPSPTTSVQPTNASPSQTASPTIPESAAPTLLATTTTTSTTTTNSTNCTISAQQPFPETTTVALYLLVNENVTETDLNFVATIFQRSYQSVVMTATSSSSSSDPVCDVYCRTITSLTIVSVLYLSTNRDSITSDASIERTYHDDDEDWLSCLQPLKVVFAVEGTYWGCQEDDTNNFPGLFDTTSNADNGSNSDDQNNNDNNIFQRGITYNNNNNKNNNSLRRLRQNQKLPVRSGKIIADSSRKTQPVLQLPSYVDKTTRILTNERRQQQELEEQKCPLSCSQETNPTSTRAYNGPTPDQILQAMEPFVTISPGICGILSIGN
jgi:hypothetical protein